MINNKDKFIHSEFKRECFELDNLLQACNNTSGIPEPAQLNHLEEPIKRTAIIIIYTFNSQKVIPVNPNPDKFYSKQLKSSYLVKVTHLKYDTHTEFSLNNENKA